MDVNRYSFICQKTMHQGLQSAKSFGHRFLEIEHIALVLLRSNAVSLPRAANTRLQDYLEGHLSKFRRVFGDVKIEFGIRLDKALDEAELEAGQELVSEDVLWGCLINHSDVMREFYEKDEKEFSPPQTEANSKKKIKKGSPKNSTNVEEKENKGGEESYFQIPEKYSLVLQEFTVDLTSLAERR